MAKVLRLHKGAIDTIENWGDSNKIGTKAIDSIADPVGATDKREITSIPSPFARMDLIKRAFKIVAEGSLDGNTIYHKLVSDCLDVGQIFFNIGKYSEQIEILAWDKDTCMAELTESYLVEHRRLGNTYGTFLMQDSTEYNFDKMDCIYLLNYIDPSAPKEMNIIGATSPATLFFTSANNLEYVGKKIKFGNDVPFDADYRPLYARDFEYVKYWWSLKKSLPDFSVLFPEVFLYLEKSYTCLTAKQKEDLRNDVRDNYYENSYDPILVSGTSQRNVKMLGLDLRCKRSAMDVKSGFEMIISDSLRVQGRAIPLALPMSDPEHNIRYTESVYYVLENWNKNTYVPYYNPHPIYERTLPDDGSQYPYVTIGDFFEDAIVKVPYKFNTVDFFNGNDNTPDAATSYILPFKKTLFDYFTVEDLQTPVCGKHRVEILRRAGGVLVILRIPIQDNRYIQYERLYTEGVGNKVNNGGSVVGCNFTIGLFPGIKYPDKVTPYYRVTLLDRNSVSNLDNAYGLTFFDASNKQVKCENPIRRNRNLDGTRFDRLKIDSVTYALESEYKYICLVNESDKDIHGVIIPKFKSKHGSRKFRFAIDLGTTNTHIEYKVDDSSVSTAFDITENDMQIQKLHIVVDDFDIDSVFNSDFIPEKMGVDSLYSYPMRTVLSESHNTNWKKSVLSMADVNIPYTYENRLSMPYNINHTNLKWSALEEDNQRVGKYIECLLLMMRNKVLLNGGDLTKTELVWFYPASMTHSRFDKFKKVWTERFVSLFNASDENVVAMSESIAPYYFNKMKNGATSTVVSVDIGGGTTDVVIVVDDEPKCLTSFRFAANTIFGDGYSYDSDTNGVVIEYKDKIANRFKENGLVYLNEVFEYVLKNKISSEIAAFWFSLASNKDVLDKKIEIDFGKMLADDKRGKYGVLLFYVAMMYHIANLMKAKGLDMPRYVTFSGNGSKVLDVLNSDNSVIAEFTKLIFERIYGMSYSIDGLDIIRPENPKEATCKGGIFAKTFASQSYSDIKEMKTVLVGSDASTLADENLTYADITPGMLDGVAEMVKRYIDFTFDLDKKFSFYDNFDIDRAVMDRVKEICYRDVKTYLKTGISKKKTEIAQDGSDNNLEETLFFYPLVGIINAIFRWIYDKK